MTLPMSRQRTHVPKTSRAQSGLLIFGLNIQQRFTTCRWWWWWWCLRFLLREAEFLCHRFHPGGRRAKLPQLVEPHPPPLQPFVVVLTNIRVFPFTRAESWLAARMQQNGSSGSNGSDGCSRERQSLSFSPLPAATTRVRRFIQERRTLPLPRVMVVFSAAGDSEKPGDAMSSSDSTEEDFRKPASPTPNLALSKPLRSSLNTQEQEVGRFLHRRHTFNQTHRQLVSNRKYIHTNYLHY